MTTQYSQKLIHSLKCPANLTTVDHTTSASTPKSVIFPLNYPTVHLGLLLTLLPFYHPFSANDQNHLQEVYQLLHFHAFSSPRLPMKTITVASQALHDLATAGPSNHSFRGLPVPRPLPRAHGPHATLASVLPPTGQAGSSLKSLHSHSLG